MAAELPAGEHETRGLDACELQAHLVSLGPFKAPLPQINSGSGET